MEKEEEGMSLLLFGFDMMYVLLFVKTVFVVQLERGGDCLVRVELGATVEKIKCKYALSIVPPAPPECSGGSSAASPRGTYLSLEGKDLGWVIFAGDVMYEVYV